MAGLDRKAIHDAANDLAVALATTYAFVDAKLPANASNLESLLEALERLNTFIGTLRAPAAPAADNELLEAIVEGSPYAKVLVDDNGRIALVNGEAERLFGYPRAEMLGQSIEMLVPQRFRSAHPALRGSFHDSPAARPMGAGRDLYGLHKDGSEVPIEIGLNPIRTAAGTFVLAAITDITERRRAEELRIRHLGIERHAAEVEELNRELARASQFKSQFVATMSHELRTPLTAIVGATELLARGTLDERAKTHVHTIEEAVEALLGIVNSILDLSKIEAGRVDLLPTAFVLETLIDGIADVTAELAGRKGLRLHTYVDPAIPPLHGDADRLRQVLLNLLGNAVKFTERGRVVARALPLDIGDREVIVRFEVEDTGIGISPEVQAVLFEPFVRGADSASRAISGTGLGLSISKRLVELMGGTIGVESEPGAGSLFWFTIPFARASEPLTSSERSAAGVGGLVVSDDETFASIVERYLESWGMPTRRAASAADILNTMESRGGPTWIAIVDLDDVVDRELLDTVRLLRSTMAKRTIAVGGGAGLRKPLRQSYLFDAIAVAAGTAAGTAPQPPVPAAEQPLHVPADAPLLVAEDNEQLQRLLKLQFDELGVPVTFVADGQAAVDALRDGRYSLAFMDIQMPRLDGFAATRAVRAAEAGTGRHVPIVAMTANAFAEDRQACVDAGMDDHLAKPVRLRSLRDTIARWVPQSPKLVR
jgi:PAS domain S-box-containing protein